MAQGYRDFAQFLSEHFDCKMQKIAINAGFSCPNRDGSKGRGGCTYCNNQTFNPAYCAPSQSITEQLEEGKRFFGKKYPDMRYLAYFQAYTNTHGDIDRIMAMYREALAVDKVDGIIIGTRPDCMPQELLDQLAELHKSHWIMIEYGAETSHNPTLDFINRCHSWEDIGKKLIHFYFFYHFRFTYFVSFIHNFCFFYFFIQFLYPVIYC